MNAGPEDRKIVVRLDRDVEDLIPQYLENRRQDIKDILSALGRGDYGTARTLGHSMKGSGGTYGFDAITRIGSDIERSARDLNEESVRKYASELTDFLDRLQVEYD